jgi:hypothetical protein
MSQFTQLNLQGRSDKPAEKIPAANQHPLSSGKKLAAFAGSVAASALLGAFLIQSSGCSKGNDRPARAAIASPELSSQPSAMPAAPVAASEPKAVKVTPRKSRQHKLDASKYANAEYGISFSYPKGYDLVQTNDADVDWSSLGPVDMNFTQPGGTVLTAVELPQRSHPGTDFSVAFFNVSVNAKLTPDQCEQFAFPQASTSETGSSANGTTSPTKLAPSRVKLGAAEFTEVEDEGGEPPKKAETKYYHLFQNGVCYEFALGLETTANKITDMPVNRNEVFRKLNWMLSTVKIETAGVPAKTVPEVAKGSGTAVPSESKN